MCSSNLKFNLECVQYKVIYCRALRFACSTFGVKAKLVNLSSCIPALIWEKKKHSALLFIVSVCTLELIIAYGSWRPCWPRLLCASPLSKAASFLLLLLRPVAVPSNVSPLLWKRFSLFLINSLCWQCSSSSPPSHPALPSLSLPASSGFCRLALEHKGLLCAGNRYFML